MALGSEVQGRAGIKPPPIFWVSFPRRLIITTWNFSVQLFGYHWRAFWDKFSDDQLLWLLDMTSYVAGGQAFWVKMHVFSTVKKIISTIKLNLVDKMKRITYLCVILQVEHKKLRILAAFTFYFGKTQDGDQDGNYVWWRQRPPAALPPIEYTSSCREDQMLSTEGKIFSKHWNISRTLLYLTALTRTIKKS